MDQNWWHKPGQSLVWWPSSSRHPSSTLKRGKQLRREAAHVPIHGAGLVLTLPGLPKAKRLTVLPRELLGSPWVSCSLPLEMH